MLIKKNHNTGLNPFDWTFNTFAKRFFEDSDIFNLNESNNACNIKESDEKYTIELQVPGFNKENIEINVDNNVVKISGKHDEEFENSNENVWKREFKKSSFSRSFQLPNDVNVDEINAFTKDGILILDINKTIKPIRKININ